LLSRSFLGTLSFANSSPEEPISDHGRHWGTSDHSNRISAIQVCYFFPPIIILELEQPSSYAEAPEWQLKFSMVWVTAVGISILLSLPHLIRAVRSRRAFHDFFGVIEDVDKYMALFDHDRGDNSGDPNHEDMRRVPRRDWRKDWLRKILNTTGATLLWTVPGLELSIGQSGWFFILKSGYVLRS
jgi:hypothetical protein